MHLCVESLQVALKAIQCRLVLVPALPASGSTGAVGEAHMADIRLQVHRLMDKYPQGMFERTHRCGITKV